MPIFHDLDGRSPPAAQRLEVEEQATKGWGFPEQNLPSKELERPTPHSQSHDGALPGRTRPDIEDLKLRASDRGELIERLKKREGPVWAPNRVVPHYTRDHDDPYRFPSPPLLAENLPLAPLLPPPELPERSISPRFHRDGNPNDAAEIERPKSALHAGDFTSDRVLKDTSHMSARPSDSNLLGPLGSFPEHPWYTSASSPPASLHFHTEHHISQAENKHTYEPSTRSRAPSLSSFSSSFVLKAPTSPLVQQSNNTDLDFSPKTDPIEISMSPGKGNRRHTLPPNALYSLQSSSPMDVRNSKRVPSLRREGTFPYQAHQPRRSLTSNMSLLHSSNSQTPIPFRSRRSSISSDVSPLHHAPLVGSYEESILRGRMSMTPSRPLNFMAQIGVLGKGECKASLRCPPHVTISFPAVFYNQWSSGGDSSGGASVLEDGPSPYVGLIDIESGIKPPKTGKRDKRNATLKPDSHRDGGRTDSSFTTGQINEVPAPRLNMQSKEKRKRRSLSPKAPPGGSYRIPQQGQLQIVLKNPNKTAVKLFLVPYDLRGMESGTKTFIRQRSYSYGPVIDMPQRLPPAFANNGADRPMLRYLIHLHICCPSKGRYFLYKSIRVVFANRVPDGNEKLQNEIQYPEPRFSVYKPCREYGDVMHSIHASASGSPRRRATGAIDSTHMDVDDGFDDRRSAVPPGSNPASNISPRSFLPVFTPPIFYPSASRLDRGGDMQVDDAFISPTSTAPALFGPPTKSASQTFSSSYKKEPEDLHSHHASESCMSGDYNKLSKGDVGYGGIPYSCQTHGFPCRDSSGAGSAGNGAGDELSSLLARHLKGLEMRKSEDAGRADPSEDF